MSHKNHLFSALPCALALAGFASIATAQPETIDWGNLTGIRVDGQLIELNSSMFVVELNWAAVSRTGRERQANAYSCEGKIETARVTMRPPRPLRDQGVAWRFRFRRKISAF